MGFTKPDSAAVNDFSSKDYADTAAAQDATKYPSSFTVTAAGQTTENEYQNTSFMQQNGAYQEVSELAGMIDRKAMFVVGKGVKTSIFKNNQLKFIKGNGLDTFNTIMYNNVRVYTIGGDSFNEIVKTKREQLRNLKPLNPSTVKVLASSKGIVKSYEVFKITHGGQAEKPEETFEADDIFHLAYNRLADQIHGESVVKKLMPIVEMRREAMQDLRVVFHRYVKPLLISSVDTDDTAEILAYKNKLDSAMEKGENLVVPKGVVDNIEKISIPQFSTLDPLPWLQMLQMEFLKAEGVPGLVMGMAGGATESEAKILYLAWQQVVEFNQMFLREQLQQQLGLKIEFEFPASIAPELIKDEGKDRGRIGADKGD